MSSNPTATLARPALQLCLSSPPRDPDLICTRLDDHDGHCCDEVVGAAWAARGQRVSCREQHDHSAEKGLTPQ